MSSTYNAKCDRIDARRKEAAQMLADIASGYLSPEAVAQQINAQTYMTRCRLLAMIACVGFANAGRVADAADKLLDLFARERV